MQVVVEVVTSKKGQGVAVALTVHGPASADWNKVPSGFAVATRSHSPCLFHTQNFGKTAHVAMTCSYRQAILPVSLPWSICQYDPSALRPLRLMCRFHLTARKGTCGWLFAVHKPSDQDSARSTFASSMRATKDIMAGLSSFSTW